MPDLIVASSFEVGVSRDEAVALARCLDEAFVSPSGYYDLGRLSLVFDRLSVVLAGPDRYAVLPLSRQEANVLRVFLQALSEGRGGVAVPFSSLGALARVRRRVQSELSRLP